jgi:hypothetical protein
LLPSKTDYESVRRSFCDIEENLGTRLEIAQEIRGLHMKEAARQRLIASIAAVQRNETLERDIEGNNEKLKRKGLKLDKQKEFKRNIVNDKKRLKEIELNITFATRDQTCTPDDRD